MSHHGKVDKDQVAHADYPYTEKSYKNKSPQSGNK